MNEWMNEWIEYGRPHPGNAGHLLELLYADDLFVIAETEDDLIKRLKWKDNVETRGMRVMNKMEVMITEERQKFMVTVTFVR